MAEELGFAGWAVDSRDEATAVIRGRSVALVVGVVGASAAEDAAWLTELWEMCPDVPVVLLGPGHQPTIARESLRLGVLEYIPRSLPPGDIRRRLGEALV